MAKQVDITVKAKDEATTVLRNIQGELVTVGRNAFNLAAAFAAVYSSRKLINFANEVTEAFNVQTEAVKGLEAALGGQAAAAQEFAEYASGLQKLTTVGDEVTLGIMRRATLLGVEEDQLKSVATAAIGVSEATGLGLNEALRKVNETINGNAKALGEYLPALKKTEDAEEQLRLVTELARDGINQKIESLSRLDGAQKAAAGAMGDLMESVGAILAPFKTLIANGIQVFAETMQNILAPAVEVATKSMDSLAQASRWVGEQVVWSVTVAEVAYNNLSKIADIAASTIALAYVGLVEDTKHTFTVVLPAYIEWFKENWLRILLDWYNATNVIFRNLASNVAGIVSEIISFIKNGFEGGLDGLSKRIAETINTNLLEGFVSVTQDLPSIAERQITAEEQALLTRIGKMGSEVGAEFNDKFAQRMQDFERSLNTKPEIELDLAATVSKDQKSEAEQLQAVEGRLLTRGRADDPNAMVAENTKATVAQLKKTNDKLDALIQKPQGDSVRLEVVR